MITPACPLPSAHLISTGYQQVFADYYFNIYTHFLVQNGLITILLVTASQSKKVILLITYYHPASVIFALGAMYVLTIAKVSKSARDTYPFNALIFVLFTACVAISILFVIVFYKIWAMLQAFCGICLINCGLLCMCILPLPPQEDYAMFFVFVSAILLNVAMVFLHEEDFVITMVIALVALLLYYAIYRAATFFTFPIKPNVTPTEVVLTIWTDWGPYIGVAMYTLSRIVAYFTYEEDADI